MQHHGHHQLDEFSVSEFRHTIHEIWRVVLARRWLFVLPACVVSALAFLGSILIPRVYEGGAIVKSEHDPVFSIVAASQWTQPFAEIRDRMESAIRNPELVGAALEARGVFRGLPHETDGSLTPEGRRDRDRIVAGVAAGLSTKTVSQTEHDRIIQIKLRHADRQLIPVAVEAIRELYIPKATEMAVQVLEDVQSFLRAEADASRDRIALLNQQLVEYELRYPGINPDSHNYTHAEQTKLIIEKVDAERELQELRMYEAELRANLDMLQSEPPSRAATASEMPNPRRAELLEEIRRLRDEIHEGLTIRDMTPVHPVIVRLREQVTLRQDELERAPATVPESFTPESNASRVAAASETARQIDKLAGRLAAREQRLSIIAKRLAEIDRMRALATEHRQGYHKTKAEIARMTSELKSWQDEIAPVSQVLYLDNKDRAVRFTGMQNAWVSTAPVNPKLSLVMLICIGIGAAVGVLSVLIAELVDHSYRTAKQLTTSLGLPVIESIDEIMTMAAARKRAVRKLLVMPTVATAAVAALVSTGALAYLSLSNPARYDGVAGTARQAVQRFVGQS